MWRVRVSEWRADVDLAPAAGLLAAMALVISIETTNRRLQRVVAIPVLGALAMFCLSFLPTLLALFASIPFIVQQRSPTLPLAAGLALSALWNHFLDRRGTQILFMLVIPARIAFGALAGLALIAGLLELTGIVAPLFG